MKKLDRFMFSFQKTFSWFVDSHFAQNLLVFKNLLQFCFADSIPFFKKKFWHCFFFCLTRVVSPLGKVNWPIHSPAVWSSSYCTLQELWDCRSDEFREGEKPKCQTRSEIDLYFLWKYYSPGIVRPRGYPIPPFSFMLLKSGSCNSASCNFKHVFREFQKSEIMYIPKDFRFERIENGYFSSL